MKVYVAGYKGINTDDILGVFTDIEKAKESIYKDYETAEFGSAPKFKKVDDNYIYISKIGEWYIVKTELN